MLPKMIRGKVWKFGDSVSTDEIMPGFTRGTTVEERASYCMRATRPEFAASFKRGDVIVGGKNFGCGSSRPAAVNLLVLGAACVVAESFGRIFFRNAVNLGLPVLYCQGVSQAFREGDTLEVDFSTATVKNVTTGKVLRGSQLPPIAIKILEAGGVISLLKKEHGGKEVDPLEALKIGGGMQF